MILVDTLVLIDFFKGENNEPCRKFTEVLETPISFGITSQILLFFLPGYSPELNPDEIPNQDVKSNAVGKKRPHNLIEMIRIVRKFLRGRQRQPHIV